MFECCTTKRKWRRNGVGISVFIRGLFHFFFCYRYVFRVVVSLLVVVERKNAQRQEREKPYIWITKNWKGGPEKSTSPPQLLTRFTHHQHV